MVIKIISRKIVVARLPANGLVNDEDAPLCGHLGEMYKISYPSWDRSVFLAV